MSSSKRKILDLSVEEDEDVEFLSTSRGIGSPDLSYSPIAKLSDIIEDPVLHSRSSNEICTGHVLALIIGGRHFLNGDTANILNYFLDFVQNDLPGIGSLYKLINNNPRTLDGHRVSVYIYKTDTKTFIWYNNPWGFDSDSSEYSFYENEHVAGNEFPDVDKSGFVPVDKSNPDYVKGYLPLIYSRDISTENNSSMRNMYQLPLLSEHVKQLVPPDDIKNAMSETMSWASETTESGKVTPSHIITTLYMLSKIFKKDHIHIIPPQKSMLYKGPQVLFNDGVDKNSLMSRKTSETVGACFTWDKIYTKHAKFMLDNRVYLSNEEVIDIIQKELRYNSLLGESSPKSLVGKIGYCSTKIQYAVKFISTLFKIIPEESVVLSDREKKTGLFRHGRQRFHVRLVKLMDALKVTISEIKLANDVPNMRDLLVNGLLTILLKEWGIEISQENKVLLNEGLVALEENLFSNYVNVSLDLVYLVVDCKHGTLGSDVTRRI